MSQSRISLRRIASRCVCAAAFTTAGLFSAGAYAVPGHHPDYVHALADLETALALLDERPGDAAIANNVNVAKSEVNRAISEGRAAARDAGKGGSAPHPDPKIALNDRLTHVGQLLQQARTDISAKEDDASAATIRDRMVQHIDMAMRANDRAIADVKAGHK